MCAFARKKKLEVKEKQKLTVKVKLKILLLTHDESSNYPSCILKIIALAEKISSQAAANCFTYDLT